MLKTIKNLIFKPKNEKYLNELRNYLPKINDIYLQLKDKTDEEILEKSKNLKQSYQEEITKVIEAFKEKKEDRIPIESEKILKKILPEAFALMKESLRREFKIELYDVQLLGGMILHFGNIAEMKTGEGKTYTAMLPAYLNALTGKQVHVVTVNEYLAKRDADKTKPVFNRLGISVGCNVESTTILKREEYKKDIVYGTSSGFGFDFLRDNSVLNYNEKLIKDKYYAIVDEVDSVLIDEARTPLIISSENEVSNDDLEMYYLSREVVKDLEVGDIIEDKNAPITSKTNIEKGDFKLDLKSKKVIFTEQGLDKIKENLLNKNVIEYEDQLYAIHNLKLFNLIQLAANAEFVYLKNKDYMVRDGRVMIIDEMTGRVQEDRQWSDGLHQAIETKENVKLSKQTHTVATTTLQHYFNKYEKIAGMTGTADTEASEFYYVYGLETFVVPTNKKIQRIDHQDRVFITKNKRDEEFIKLIKDEHGKGRPILIGTNSVKDNEFYSDLLNQHNIPHEVLNAKNHLREAEIIAKAGEKGSVTLATNMAGRGTDIILGGNSNKQKEELLTNIFHSNHYIDAEIEKLEKSDQKRYLDIIDLKGLLVVSLGRNESRRVDNQLRGRSGRQGDIGESVFLVSLDDDIFKPFGIEKVKSMALAIDNTGDTEITGKIFSSQLTKIQRKIEEFHFENRKRVMQFSEPLDKQTDVVYDYRDSVLKNEKTEDFIKQGEEMLIGEIQSLLDKFIPLNSFEESWDIERVNNLLSRNKIDFSIEKYLKENDKNIDTEKFKEIVLEKFKNIYLNITNKYKENKIDFGELIRQLILKQIDKNWLEHLNDMDYLRSSVNLKGYSGKDPKEIFKKESFELFEGLFLRVRADIVEDILILNLLE